MKIFIGPTGVGLDLSGLEVLPPAEQGNIAAAAMEGPDTLILIDGYFSQHLAPWHKEILFAISKGCRVIGAGSLGALRAVECRRYGMESAGLISTWYEDGTCTDDGDVAVAHRHAEDGYTAITIPMVNLIATVKRLGYLGVQISDNVLDRCRAIFYAERNWSALTHFIGADATLLRKHYVDQKAIDAMAAIKLSATPRRTTQPEIPTASPVLESMPILAAKSGSIRPWQMATDRHAAVDAMMLFELASAVGIKATDREVVEASARLWRNLGITDTLLADQWMINNRITQEQWGRAAVREAVIQAARNWFDSASCGCELIPVTLRHQLFNPPIKVVAPKS